MNMSSSGFVQPLVELELQDLAASRRAMDDAALHERLVAYTDAISGAISQDRRSGVWNEHSYARARTGAPSASVRVLLAPRALDDDHVDVCTWPRSPPPLPLDESDDEPDTPDEHDDDWEERVAEHPPSAAHARLALAALQALRDARLALLARSGGRAVRREEARAAARRLRTALAPLWAGAGPASAPRPPAWLHARLHAHLPAAYRALYEDVLSELRRAVPRLAERLGAASLPPARIDPLTPERFAARGPQEPGPWLAWVRCGCGRAEARWERRLGALVHVRVIAARASQACPAPPDRWAADVLYNAKQALADIIEEAKGRAVVVGGAGAGGAMAAALAAAGAGVRATVLVGASTLTAEGARWAPDDTLQETGATLLAAGGRAEALAGGPRRLLAVAGADAALRLPLHSRRRLRLPQHALDAALAEEIARWVFSTTEAAPGSEAEETSGAAGRAGAPGGGPALGEGEAGEEYAHLPALAITPAQNVGGNRTVEIVEGRMVARVSGSTPLMLTPRRAPPEAPGRCPPRPPRAAPATPAAAPTAALEAADIMQLPIVFVDDESPALTYSDASAVDKPVTVTSGGARGGGTVRYTRVIVAKRGMRGAPPGAVVGGRAGPSGAVAGAVAGGRAGPGARGLLRRGGRIVRGP